MKKETLIIWATVFIALSTTFSFMAQSSLQKSNLLIAKENKDALKLIDEMTIHNYNALSGLDSINYEEMILLTREHSSLVDKIGNKWVKTWEFEKSYNLFNLFSLSSLFIGITLLINSFFPVGKRRYVSLICSILIIIFIFYQLDKMQLIIWAS